MPWQLLIQVSSELVDTLNSHPQIVFQIKWQ